ncbi:sas10/Utp3/C1D family protein [Hirsutella rhossiliensis]|uniref:Sas10/Utp3/C1D family domain-containing protein n=1 Tax=Hirsutella rhossiliensis TaxID=111463 RepID=A0A9P8SLQ9_9HYPO|nr:sas10/Utp3/C1D family domain-containing protein [Hirsutella rhossiliensis]KAH0966529.1 sas10/Utp3/C1D family domain-containing protein [Hirsutella rhossiliensis]
MAAPTTLPALLASLTQSLSLTEEAAPKIAAIESPKDGISLLDVKNELLLSYLQNLVFLILLKLRNSRSTSDDADQGGDGLDESVRAKLVELRLYLERGARPLEEKLRFSIERFLRTAEDAQRQTQNIRQRRKANGSKDSGSDDEDASSDQGDEDEDEDLSGQGRPVQHRPGQTAAAPRLGTLMDDVTAKRADHEDGPSGIYRPPKRDRHAMETTRPREKADRRPHKSHTMEEFVQSEFATAPVAEPSIGTTIVQGGRKTKTVQERKDEAERRDYEEMNLVRLPKLSKKERAKKNKEAGRSGHMQFGGEEWRDLGEGVDRIDRLTKRKGPAGGGVRALLEKSRKRGFDTTDGPRSSGHGAEIGDRFQKKVKMLEAGRRDRGKKR